MRPAGGLATAFAVVAFGCATPPVADHGDRLARAGRGLQGDPTVEARLEQVDAALAREANETSIEELQLRVGDAFRPDRDEGRDNRVRLRARIPLPHPGELRALRQVRRAETEVALSRLEETALERRAEHCLRAVEAATFRAVRDRYHAYAAGYARLLEQNERARRAGTISLPIATRFEIETQIKLATRAPGLPPLDPALAGSLPVIAAPDRRLVTRVALLRQTIRERHPTVSIHRAVSARYDALAAHAHSRARPWPEFVDFDYEASARRERREAGARVAFRVPLGASAEQRAVPYDALSRGERRLGDGEIEERVRIALLALREIDAFERGAARWEELLELAGRAESEADRWWQQRLASPSQVGALLDHAHAARVEVIEARDRAASARCSLLAATGVRSDDWPRE